MKRMSDNKNILRKDEIEVVANVLKKLSPGVIPYEIFIEYARLIVMPTIEFVPLRFHEGKVQVLLISREDSDTHWSGMVHIPGTVIRASDEKGSFKSALNRIFVNELGNQVTIGEVFFMKYLFHQVKRGSEISFVHWAEIKGKSENGTFYDVDNLPENIVEHQIIYIKEAAEEFVKKNLD